MGFRLLLELNIFPDHPCMVYLPKVNIYTIHGLYGIVDGSEIRQSPIN